MDVDTGIHYTFHIRAGPHSICQLRHQHVQADRAHDAPVDVGTHTDQHEAGTDESNEARRHSARHRSTSGSRTPRSTTQSVRTQRTKPSIPSPASHSVRPTPSIKHHRSHRHTSPARSKSGTTGPPDKSPDTSRRRSSPTRSAVSPHHKSSRSRSSSRPTSRPTPNRTSSRRRRRSTTPPSSSRHPATRATSETSRVETHHNHHTFTRQEREELGDLYQRALQDPHRLECVTEMYHTQDPPPPADPSKGRRRKYMDNLVNDINKIAENYSWWATEPAQQAIRQVARSFANAHPSITPYLCGFRDTGPPHFTPTSIQPEILKLDPCNAKANRASQPLVQVLVIPLRKTRPPPFPQDDARPLPPLHKGTHRAYWSHATDEAGLWHILREGFVRPTNWQRTNWDDADLTFQEAYLPHRGFNGFHQDNGPDHHQLGIGFTNLQKALRIPKAKAGPSDDTVSVGYTVFGKIKSGAARHSHIKTGGGGWATQKGLLEEYLNDRHQAYTAIFSHPEKRVIDAQNAEITGITINLFHPRSTTPTSTRRSRSPRTSRRTRRE